MTIENRRNFPNFFIVGAEKAGTTSLYHYLGQHPQVFLSMVKEPNYFCKDIFPPEDFKIVRPPFKKFIHTTFIREFDVYTELFSDVKDEVAVGEASVSYLPSEVAAREIKKFNPEAKVIIILRNPVVRAFSEYKMDITIGRTSKDFLSAFHDNSGYRERSLYYEQVKRYVEAFPAKNLFIKIFEEMKKDMKRTISEIFRFLEVDSSFTPNLEVRYNWPLTPKIKTLNSILFESGIKKFLSNIVPERLKEPLKRFYYDDRSNKLSKEEFKALFPFFYEDIKKLERLIGKDLSNWQSPVD